MKRQCLVVLAALIAVVPFTPGPGCSQSASKKAYTPPKTPWGDPDLQGMWPGTDLIGVPMQRPANFGSRTVLTDEEFNQRQTQAERTAASDAEEFARPDAKAGI